MDVSCWYVLLYQWKPEWSLVIVMWWHGSCGAEITWTSVGDLKRDPEGLEPRYVSSRSISWLMHLFIKSREKTKRRIRPNHLKYRLVYSWAAAPRKGDEELRDLHGPTTQQQTAGPDVLTRGRGDKGKAGRHNQWKQQHWVHCQVSTDNEDTCLLIHTLD